MIESSMSRKLLKLSVQTVVLFRPSFEEEIEKEKKLRTARMT